MEDGNRRERGRGNGDSSLVSGERGDGSLVSFIGKRVKMKRENRPPFRSIIQAKSKSRDLR